jgi:hypothetical protein
LRAGEVELGIERWGIKQGLRDDLWAYVVGVQDACADLPYVSSES